MNALGWLLTGIVIAAVLFATFGQPSQVEWSPSFPFVRLSWAAEEKEEEPLPQPPTVVKKVLGIKIDSISSRQKIYSPGDIAYVDFVINNTLGVPYNLTVDWLLGDKRHHGWQNMSTEIYNITNEKNNWWSSYNVTRSGEWTAHLIVTYGYENKSYSQDEITTFQVV